MLKGLIPDRFLREFWQKHPHFFPSAIDRELPLLEPDELAWLAMQPDVESRLVFTEQVDGKASYRVSNGPFTESELGALPDHDWTLLVQDVEKHLPDFREWFELCPFIPSWRIDDLMISVAAPGGSVGPHRDNYDVFLCQGNGSRHWQLTSDRNVPEDTSAAELSLLRPFQAELKRDCTTGDVLYVPPGIPHWGIALDLCTTYSIGMRAPTNAELLAGYGRIFEQDGDTSGDAVFYHDDDLGEGESDGGRISIACAHRIRDQGLLDRSLNDEQLMIVLGSVVTDPKAWLDPEPATADDLSKAILRSESLNVHAMALLAYCEGDTFSHVFANGGHRKLPVSCLDLIRSLCRYRRTESSTLAALGEHSGGAELVAWLLEMGVFDIPRLPDENRSQPGIVGKT